MKVSHLFETWDGTARVNRWQLLINVVLAVCLAALTVKSLSDRERVVLIPPHLSERAEVAWNKANDQYYEGFGMYVASMIGNITPRTAEFIAEQLAFIVSPDIYQSMRAQILAIANDPLFQKGDQFNYFSPEVVFYEPETNKVYVSGVVTTSAFTKTIETLGKIAENKDITYELKMDIVNGRPIVVAFDSYYGKNPHTEQWKAKNPDKVEKLKKDKENRVVQIQPDVQQYASSEPIAESSSPKGDVTASAAK